MKANKIYWACISVRSGEIKEKGNATTLINKVSPGNVLTFERRKDAKQFIENKLAWALRPVKISFDGVACRFEFSL